MDKLRCTLPCHAAFTSDSIANRYVPVGRCYAFLRASNPIGRVNESNVKLGLRLQLEILQGLEIGVVEA